MATAQPDGVADPEPDGGPNSSARAPSDREVTPVGRHARRAFTFVELLMRILIVTAGSAIVVPFFLTTVSGVETRTARANMRSIADGMEAYEARWQVYTTSFADLAADLGSDQVPAGPGSRTYVISLRRSGCTDDHDAPQPGYSEFAVSDNVPADGVYCPGISPN
jgi:Tfp pilus assembly protein PilE